MESYFFDLSIFLQSPKNKIDKQIFLARKETRASINYLEWVLSSLLTFSRTVLKTFSILTSSKDFKHKFFLISEFNWLDLSLMFQIQDSFENNIKPNLKEAPLVSSTLLKFLLTIKLTGSHKLITFHPSLHKKKEKTRLSSPFGTESSDRLSFGRKLDNSLRVIQKCYHLLWIRSLGM